MWPRKRPAPRRARPDVPLTGQLAVDWGMSLIAPLAPAITAERMRLMFPTLTPAQIERVANHGAARAVRQGEVLFADGDRVVPFFVLRTGTVDIVRPSRDGDTLIVTHAAGEFTGETNMLSGRRSLVRAQATSDGEVIELSRDQLLSLVRCRTRTGSKGASRSTRRGSSRPVPTSPLRTWLRPNGRSRGGRTCSKRACPRCSRSATYVVAASSGSRRRSGRARSPSRSSTRR